MEHLSIPPKSHSFKFQRILVLALKIWEQRVGLDKDAEETEKLIQNARNDFQAKQKLASHVESRRQHLITIKSYNVNNNNNIISATTSSMTSTIQQQSSQTQQNNPEPPHKKQKTESISTNRMSQQLQVVQQQLQIQQQQQQPEL